MLSSFYWLSKQHQLMRLNWFTVVKSYSINVLLVIHFIFSSPSFLSPPSHLPPCCAVPHFFTSCLCLNFNFFSSTSLWFADPFIVSASAPTFSFVPSLSPSLLLLSSPLFCRLRLARMNEEMREAEAPLGQPGQYPSSSPTEQQYRKCIQEFICLTIDEC